MGSFQDQIDNTYLNSRNAAYDRDSPLNKIKQQGQAEGWETASPASAEAMENLSPSDLADMENPDLATGETAEPLIDPVSAFTGGFAGTAKLAASKGIGLTKSLLKGLVAGSTGAVAELPIGTAAEVADVKFPGSGLAVSVIGGFVSGAAIESKIDDAVTSYLTKQGAKSADKGVIKATTKQIKHNLANGKLDDEATLAVKADVDQFIEDEKIVSLKNAFEFKGGKLDKAGNINLARIDTEDDVKSLMKGYEKTFTDEFNVAKRGVKTNLETEAESAKVQLSTILGRDVGEALSAPQALAARKALTTSGEQLVGLAKKIQGLDASDADKIKFRKAVMLHKALQEQVTGATSEAGRALQQFKIRAKSDKLMLRNIDDIMERMGDEGDLTDAMAMALAGARDAEHLNKLVGKINKAKTSDVVMELWINSLLSGPQTHAVNSLSNTLTALIQIPERVVGAGFSKMLQTGPDGIKFREGLSQTVGMVEGFKDGLRAAGETIRRGTAQDVVGKLEMPHPKAISGEGLELSGTAGRMADYVGQAVRFPGTMLGAEDAFFKSVGYRMELNAQATRMASAEGLSGKPLAMRIKEIVSDPPDNIKLASVDAARYQTFTNSLTGWTADYQKFASKHPAMRVITPFIRTPVNIMSFAIERSPAAPVLKGFRTDIMAGGARRDLALARMSTGSMIMATAGTYAAGGTITGKGPSDPRIKKQMFETGWLPYSVQVGGKYYSYGRLEPLGSLLGLAADFVDISGNSEDAEVEEMAVALSASVAQNLTSKTFLRGVTEIIQALEDPERYGDNYVQNLIGTAVPTGVAQIARIQDPTLREVRSVMDKLMSRIPGLSDNLPPRLNLWGESVMLGGGLGPDIISPVYTSREGDPDPVDEEIVRLELPISMPARNVGGVELNQEQYNKYVEMAAGSPARGVPVLKEQIRKQMKTREYKRGTDGSEGTKAMQIRSIIMGYREAAQGKMHTEFPELSLKIQNKQRAKFGAPALIQ